MRTILPGFSLPRTSSTSNPPRPYATGASTGFPSCAKGGHFPGLLEPRWAERALPAPEAQVQGASTRLRLKPVLTGSPQPTSTVMVNVLAGGAVSQARL